MGIGSPRASIRSGAACVLLSAPPAHELRGDRHAIEVARSGDSNLRCAGGCSARTRGHRKQHIRLDGSRADRDGERQPGDRRLDAVRRRDRSGAQWIDVKRQWYEHSFALDRRRAVLALLYAPACASVGREERVRSVGSGGCGRRQQQCIKLDRRGTGRRRQQLVELDGRRPGQRDRSIAGRDRDTGRRGLVDRRSHDRRRGLREQRRQLDRRRAGRWREHVDGRARVRPVRHTDRRLHARPRDAAGRSERAAALLGRKRPWKQRRRRRLGPQRHLGGGSCELAARPGAGRDRGLALAPGEDAGRQRQKPRAGTGDARAASRRARACASTSHAGGLRDVAVHRSQPGRLGAREPRLARHGRRAQETRCRSFTERKWRRARKVVAFALVCVAAAAVAAATTGTTRADALPLRDRRPARPDPRLPGSASAGHRDDGVGAAAATGGRCPGAAARGTTGDVGNTALRRRPPPRALPARHVGAGTAERVTQMRA